LRLQRTLRELAFPAEYVNSLVTSDA